jgi:hypothetical protein
MNFNACFRGLILSLALSALFCLPAFADGSGDRTQFGHDITVGAGEEVTEATCFGCSIRVRGKVKTDVTTFGGNIFVEDGGEVGSDLTSFGGNVRMSSGAKADGGVTVFGGRLQRDPDASITGDVTTFSGYGWMALIFVLPLVVLCGIITLFVLLIRRIMRPSVPLTA